MTDGGALVLRAGRPAAAGPSLGQVAVGQTAVGQTAIDDLDGNALPWTLGVLAYQPLHTLRTTALSGSWRTAQPERLHLWLFRLPAKLTVTPARPTSSS